MAQMQLEAATEQQVLLVVDDREENLVAMEALLENSAWQVRSAASGEAALRCLLENEVELVLLDVQMPQLDGWQVLSEIRARGDTPVIMLTALDQDLDKLMGLRMGADDYVVKPFNPAEVVARVQAVLRRIQAAKQTMARVLRVGPFQIDLESHEASICRDDGQQRLELTLTEFKLLASLMRAPKRAFSRAELLTHCLPEGDTQERTVDSHISKLRKKLEEVAVQGMPVSLRGVGYRLEDVP